MGGCCILNHELSSSEVTSTFTSGVIFVDFKELLQIKRSLKEHEPSHWNTMARLQPNTALKLLTLVRIVFTLSLHYLEPNCINIMSMVCRSVL